jgi:flagellar protein FlaF
VAAASLVATAIGIVLLIVTAYVLVGGTLTATETLMNAQSEMTSARTRMLGTSVRITGWNGTVNPLLLDVENTGSESIMDLEFMDIFLLQDGTPVRYSYTESGVTGSWSRASISPDLVHPGQWDPNETLHIQVSYEAGSPVPVWAEVVTGNGAVDSTYL